MFDKLRVRIAELMMRVASRVAPRYTSDGMRVRKAVEDYAVKAKQEREAEDLERRWKWDPYGTYLSEKEKEEKDRSDK